MENRVDVVVHHSDCGALTVGAVACYIRATEVGVL